MDESKIECKNEVNALEINCFIATTGIESYFMSFKVANLVEAVRFLANSDNFNIKLSTEFTF